ncbi:MAG: RIP metalloprotease RseP [Clostridia bacterium]|nr:RIP metalloprotease RseP [Clostridia bacterium]
MTAVYILIAILIFGLLVVIHEGGHFLFARLFHVTVNEFSIGMGPKIISKKSKKTGIAYSLRAFPVGGYVAMTGEDEDSDDPDAFCNKPVWKRLVITAAGAIINITAGIVVMTILIASSNTLYGTEIFEMKKDIVTSSVSSEETLQPGDVIISVGGAKVYTANDLVYQIMRRGIEPCDIVVTRDGENTVIKDYAFPIVSEEGTSFGQPDFYVKEVPKTFTNVLKHSFFRSVSSIKMIWEQFYDLIRGRYSLKSVSGPVGVTQALGEAARSGADTFLFLTAFISINLGVVNLFPLPALDGGRLIFLLIEAVRRKPVPRKTEGFIHMTGLALLLLIMVIVTFKDIFGLFS